MAGYSVQFVAATTVVAQFAKGHSEGKLEERLAHFAKPKLLIIDELGASSPPRRRDQHLCIFTAQPLKAT